ncbi:MAG: hypothetical protein KUG73_10595 [Pseudomonadales bacterium]|nr:hypothetical protein [Pseudomonadales bacterium]
MAISPIAKLQKIFHEKGFFEFVSLVALKLIRKLIYKRQSIVFLNRDLSLEMRKYKSSKRWYAREFTRNDIPLCRDHFQRFESDYNDLFDLNLNAFAAFETETDQMIAIAWYADKDFYDQHYLHQTFTVSDHQVFQFAGEVSEPYRNTQISISVIKIAWEYWKAQGKTELTTTVDTLNNASIRYLFHLGWTETGKIQHFHQLFRYRWQRMEHYNGERFIQFKKRKNTVSK